MYNNRGCIAETCLLLFKSTAACVNYINIYFFQLYLTPLDRSVHPITPVAAILPGRTFIFIICIIFLSRDAQRLFDKNNGVRVVHRNTTTIRVSDYNNTKRKIIIINGDGGTPDF